MQQQGRKKILVELLSVQYGLNPAPSAPQNTMNSFSSIRSMQNK
jgi:hypothetical protein